MTGEEEAGGTGHMHPFAALSSWHHPLRLTVFKLTSLQRCLTGSMETPPLLEGSPSCAPPPTTLPQNVGDADQCPQISLKPASPPGRRVNGLQPAPAHTVLTSLRVLSQNPLSVSTPSLWVRVSGSSSGFSAAAFYKSHSRMWSQLKLLFSHL